MADAPKRGSGELDDIEDALWGEELGDLGVSDMDSDEGADQMGGVLHHAPARRGCSFCEDLGMAWVTVAREVQCFFIDGCGGDGGDVACESGVDRSDNLLKRSFTALRADLTWDDGIGVDGLEIENGAGNVRG